MLGPGTMPPRSRMELILVRHGQSTNNADPGNRVPDPDLTDLGYRQAAAVAPLVAELGPFDALYSSPFIRTLRTAIPISSALALPIRVAVELHEWGGMVDELPDGPVSLPGLTRDEMLEVVPGAMLPAGVNDRGWWFEEWHGPEDVPRQAARDASRFLFDLYRAHGPDERVCAVVHAGSGDSIIRAAIGIDTRNQCFETGNTALSAVSWTDNVPRVGYVNRMDHLPVDLRS